MLGYCVFGRGQPKRTERSIGVAHGVADAGARLPKVRYFSGLPAVWVHFANSALIWNTLLPCLVRAADRGRVLEPEEKGGTPAKSPLAAGVPVR
jgi:hypothetical protein